MSDKTEEQTTAGLAIIAGLGMEIGKHIKSALQEQQTLKGVPRNLSNYNMNAAGVIVADRPQQGRVWEVRALGVWVTGPLAVQAGNVAIFIGGSPDSITAVGANVPNSECVIPSQPLPFFLHLGRGGGIVYRNGEVLYAALSSVASPGFMSLNVVEYDETDYFSRITK
jgi:hypothetical protein